MTKRGPAPRGQHFWMVMCAILLKRIEGPQSVTVFEMEDVAGSAVNVTEHPDDETIVLSLRDPRRN